MSEQPISNENLSTVAAVAAVLALLSLVYGIYVHRQLQLAQVALVGITIRLDKEDQQFREQIKALTDRISALEAEKAAAPPPTPPAPEPK